LTHSDSPANDALQYVESTSKDVIINGNGTIRLYADEKGNLSNFALPSYVGKNIFSYTGQPAEIRYLLMNIEEKKSLILNIESISGGYSGNCVVADKDGRTSSILLTNKDIGTKTLDIFSS
jgi:hypothetical protein